MTEALEPIRRIGTPDLVALDHGERDLTVHLSAVPPPGWAEGFDNPAQAEWTPTMVHQPRLLGATVQVRCTADNFDAYMKNIDQRISSANRRYMGEVLPQLERERQARAEAEQRRQDAQAQADAAAARWAAEK